jgi:hypothetical protein
VRKWQRARGRDAPCRRGGESRTHMRPLGGPLSPGGGGPVRPGAASRCMAPVSASEAPSRHKRCICAVLPGARG